jgi:hypothetical protein
LPAFLRNEEVPVWREIASVFVASVILSILYFALWGPPYLIMSYPHFLATTLLGQAICMIIYFAGLGLGAITSALLYLRHFRSSFCFFHGVRLASGCQAKF